MNHKCCVCKSSRQDAMLYHFPCSEERRLKWLKCLNRDHLLKLNQKKLSRLFVCGKHFEKQFTTPSSRLSVKAYPSLFTEEEILTGIPTRENSENLDPRCEHSYTRKIHYDHSYCKKELEEVIPDSSELLTLSPERSNDSPTFEDLVKFTPIASAALDSQPLAVSDNQTQTVLDKHPEAVLDSQLPTVLNKHAEAVFDSQPLTVLDTYAEAVLDNQPVTVFYNHAEAIFDSQPLTVLDSQPVTVLYKHPEAVYSREDSEPQAMLDSQPQVQQQVTDSPKNVKNPKPPRKRLINKVKDLSPISQALYKELKKSKKLAQRRQRPIIKVMKFNKEQSFEKLTKNMNPFAKKLMKMQVDLCSKKKKGYRFSTEDKVMALSIMNESPKCYEFLQKIFILPSKITLNKMLAKKEVAE